MITLTINAATMEEARAKLNAFFAVPPPQSVPASATEPATPAEPVTPEPPKKQNPAPAEPGIAPPLTEVRAALAELRKAKSAASAKEILERHGVASLSELPEEAYAAVIQEAREAMQ